MRVSNQKRKICRGVALVLALLMVLGALSGCARQQEDTPPLPMRDIQPPAAESAGGVAFDAQLYFLSSGGNMLLAERQRVYCLAGESRAQALVRALCLGPGQSSSSRAVIPDTLQLDSVALSGDVCLIYFSGTIDTQQLLIARAALAATVTQLDHVEYIDVYVNDTQPGYNDRPLGAMTAISEDLDEYLVSLQQEYEYLNVDTDATLFENRNALLYYTDSAGNLLLCEPRKMIYARTTDMSSIVSNLLEEWEQGPSASTDYVNLLPDGMSMVTAPIVTGLDRRSQTEDGQPVTSLLGETQNEAAQQAGDSGEVVQTVPGTGAQIIERNQAGRVQQVNQGQTSVASNVPGESTNPLLQAGLDQVVEVRFSPALQEDYNVQLFCAGLVYTITGFCPNMYGVRIAVGNNFLSPASLLDMDTTRDYFIRSDFSHLLGESIYLAYPDSASNGLRSMTRCVPQAEAYRPVVRLQQLLDTEILSPLSAEDILDVYVVEDVAVVNWREGFLQKLQAYLQADVNPITTENRERSFVYSIVNTLSELEGVEQVWMLQEGERILDTPAMIWLGNPLLRNSGLMLE